MKNIYEYGVFATHVRCMLIVVLIYNTIPVVKLKHPLSTELYREPFYLADGEQENLLMAFIYYVVKSHGSVSHTCVLEYSCLFQSVEYLLHFSLSTLEYEDKGLNAK